MTVRIFSVSGLLSTRRIGFLIRFALRWPSRLERVHFGGIGWTKSGSFRGCSLFFYSKGMREWMQAAIFLINRLRCAKKERLTGRVAETVDAAVSKTAEGSLMSVRFRPRPPYLNQTLAKNSLPVTKYSLPSRSRFQPQ